MLYRLVVLFCACAIRLGSRHRVEVRGAENVPAHGPAVIVANHASFLDPPVVAMAVGRQIHFMARGGVLAVPLLGGLLRRCGVFPVRPHSADRQAIRHAVGLLARGELLGIFPEGTRSGDGRLQQAEPGAALIAARANVPLIPVAIEGTQTAMPRNSRWIRRARIRVNIGQPILPAAEATERSRAAELAGISRRIMEQIETLLEESARRAA